MSTGNGKQKPGKKLGEPRAVGLRFTRDRIVVSLDDQREVSVPLERYPTLDRATATKRSQWILLGHGQGFHWAALDLDLSVAGLINGLKEALPRPPASAKGRRKQLVAG